MVKVKVKVHRIDPTRGTIHTISKWQEELSKLIYKLILHPTICVRRRSIEGPRTRVSQPKMKHWKLHELHTKMK